MEQKIPKATMSRLPRYLRYLYSLRDVTQVSATTIARNLELGEVQVRKDLRIISGIGRPKVGYETDRLLACLEEILGSNNFAHAVLVGAGRLGQALMEYKEIEDYGVRILAAFDASDIAIKFSHGREILPMNQFDDFCRKNSIKIGIITVGSGSAQDVCDMMIRSGITAIWNFAPGRLRVPNGVHLKQEKLALSMAYLKTKLEEETIF